jgi:hypothetical protein
MVATSRRGLVSRPLSRFCRHNRLTTQCPICSREAEHAAPSSARARRRPSRPSRRGASAGAARPARGPSASIGPYEDGHEIRLERVPGGLRLAAWQAGQIARSAPVLAADDLVRLLGDAAAKGLLEAPPAPEAGVVAHGEHGASPGRSGELRDELRVERLDSVRVRLARWVLRPNAGWEIQQAPVMLPPERFSQALAAAARRGVLASEPRP